MGTRTELPRVVLNSNARIAAELSRNPNSPTVELRERWRRGDFVLLYSPTLMEELGERLLERGVPEAKVGLLLTEIEEKGELVKVAVSDVLPVITADPDDDHVLACAVVGKATHIITYDPHFDPLGGQYRGIRILKPLEFLEFLRETFPTPWPTST